MITKHTIIVIATSVVIAAAIPFIYLHKTGHKTDYRTFHSAAGWGYDILTNHKIIIHQEYIPVIATQKGFNTQAEAEKTAQLVITKMKGDQFPALSYAELSTICSPDELSRK